MRPVRSITCSCAVGGRVDRRYRSQTQGQIGAVSTAMAQARLEYSQGNLHAHDKGRTGDLQDHPPSIAIPSYALLYCEPEPRSVGESANPNPTKDAKAGVASDCVSGALLSRSALQSVQVEGAALASSVVQRVHSALLP